MEKREKKRTRVLEYMYISELAHNIIYIKISQ